MSAKTVFVNRFFYPDESATSQILSDLVFDLVSNGRRVEVVASRMKYDDASFRLAARETVRGAEVFRVLTTRFGRAGLLGRSFDYLSFYVSAFFVLLARLERGDVVVAETDPPLVSVVAAAAAAVKGARLVNWTQDLFPEVAEALGVKPVRALSGTLRWLRNLSLRSASMNVAIGERMADSIRAQGVPAGRVKVIHNWADGSAVRPSASSSLRTAWGLEGKFVVGYSGNMGRAHEFDAILSAARALSDEKGIAFLFVGSGKQRSAVEAAGLANAVFKPYQPYEKLGESLAAADAHLVCLKPSLEGLIVPSKFYGILAAGRPVINVGDPAGELARWVTRAACGVSVDPRDAEGLTRVVLDWSKSPEEARRAGERGRDFFEKNFNRPLALKAWYDVLRESAVKP